MRPARSIGFRHAQRGAATLVIVMMLFLIMALLAAYANRSLVFEQRISGSYYRASIAQEMADGGIDWTVALLNGTGINANCEPVATGGQRFVNRYYNVYAADRKSEALFATTSTNIVDCARTSAGLVCRCPLPSATRVAQPSTAATELVPSVGIALGTAANSVGSLPVTSTACTASSIDTCGGNAATQAVSQRAYARAKQTSQVAFIAAVPSFPASPLTVRGALSTSGTGGLGLHNTDPRSAGALVVSGEAQPASLQSERMDSLPGTPVSQALLFNEATLAGADTDAARDKVFQTFLGMAPKRYKNHPALRTVACTAADCRTLLKDAYDAGKRMLWVEGNMALSSDLTLGSESDPVILVVNGDVSLTGPIALTGMLVVQGTLTWANGGGTSLITGSVLVTKTMATTDRVDILYKQAVADQLRNRLGSYARVSGGWIDTDSK